MDTHRLRLCIAALLLPILIVGCPALPVGGSTYTMPSEALKRVVPQTAPPDLPKAAALTDLQRYAALNNPGLEASFQHWKAAMERIAQARSLPDPRLEYGYFLEEVETRVGPQRQRMALMQMFPWFGKLRLRGDVAARSADAAWQRFQAAKLTLYSRVAEAAAELYYLDHAVAVTQENAALVEYLERVARARYEAASAGHPDVIKAQVELGKLQDRLATLKELRPVLGTKLNAVLGRPETTAVPTLGALPEQVPPADVPALIEWMRRGNPELKALAAEIEKSRSAIELARKDFFPDITLGVQYIDTAGARVGNPSGSGKDPVVATVGLNLPIWYGKYRAAVREHEARLRAAQFSHADRSNQLVSEIRMALFRAQDAQRKMVLYGDTLVPMGRQHLKATESAFRAGTAEFLNLIDAQRMLLEFQLARDRAVADRMKHLAMLDRLIGREAPRTTETEATP